MSPVILHESGLAFGPFDERDCFAVEASALYAGVRDGVQMVELMLARRKEGGGVDLLLVEAKSTAPRAESAERFDEYFARVRDKMVGALLLFVSARLGRHGGAGDELPAGLASIPLDRCGIRFVLVVATAEDAWLPPLQDKLRLVMRPVTRAFGLDPNSTTVLNRHMAHRAALIA